jgi:hypothetical protein
MIAHKTMGMEEPMMPIIHLLQNIEQHPSILIVPKNGSSCIPLEVI